MYVDIHTQTPTYTFFTCKSTSFILQWMLLVPSILRPPLLSATTPVDSPFLAHCQSHLEHQGLLQRHRSLLSPQGNADRSRRQVSPWNKPHQCRMGFVNKCPSLPSYQQTDNSGRSVFFKGLDLFGLPVQQQLNNTPFICIFCLTLFTSSFIFSGITSPKPMCTQVLVLGSAFKGTQTKTGTYLIFSFNPSSRFHRSSHMMRHVASHGSTYFTVWRYHSFYNHPPHQWILACLQSLAIAYDVLKNILMHISL